MKTKQNIIWLASYPKSGNTWFRAFLTALLTEKELDINKMGTDGIFSDKGIFESTLDLNADDIPFLQIDQMRKLLYGYLAMTSEKNLYIKIHDAYTFSDLDGSEIIPSAPTKLAIYIIRNPLDVSLSLANHVDKSIQKTIDKFICKVEGSFGVKKVNSIAQFYQPLGTWNQHVESWLKCPGFPVHFIKYEDMKDNPFETFKSALEVIGLHYTDEQIQHAINQSTFEKLKNKELESGFKERFNLKSTFFNQGKVGRWKTELTEEQIEQIREANEPMMREFGYW